MCFLNLVTKKNSSGPIGSPLNQTAYKEVELESSRGAQ